MPTTTKLQPNPFQSEILEFASKQKSNAKRVEVLQEYKNPALTQLLAWNFNPNILSALPEGDVPYADVEEQTSTGKNLTDLVESKAKNQGMKSSGYYGTEDFVEENMKTSLRKEYKNFKIFVQGGNQNISKIRKETIFINMVRGLHPSEARLICAVKDKKLEELYPKITFGIVNQAFPEINWNLISENLQLVSNQRSNVKRVELLQKMRHPALTALFIWNFDPSILTDLPEKTSVPNFSKNIFKSSLKQEYGKLYNFVKGGNNNLSQEDKENIFDELIVKLHPDEAKVLFAVRNKNLESLYPNITFDLVRQAFSDIKWGGRV